MDFIDITQSISGRGQIKNPLGIYSKVVYSREKHVHFLLSSKRIQLLSFQEDGGFRAPRSFPIIGQTQLPTNTVKHDLEHLEYLEIEFYNFKNYLVLCIKWLQSEQSKSNNLIKIEARKFLIQILLVDCDPDSKRNFIKKFY